MNMLNKCKKYILLVIILTSLVNICFAEYVYAADETPKVHLPNDSKDIQEFMDDLMAKQLKDNHIPGATVSVVADGKMVFSKGYGYSDLDKKKVVEADKSLFRIGSCTKLFTWTAVMQLAEQGKIDLDADINKYLKDFKIPSTFQKPITMKNLMSHTSGFEDKLSNVFDGSYGSLKPLEETLKENMPARIYEPGKIIAYSNYGTTLAGYIVEQVSGEKYEDYVQKNIFNPLEMNNTTFQQPITGALKEDEALGHVYADGKYYEYRDAFVQYVPAGAASSTADDMAKFMIAQLNLGEYKDKRMLKEETAKLMHTQYFTNDSNLPGMCLGFFEWNRNGKRILWHQGGSELFRTLVMLIPEENVGVFVSYNNPDGGEDARTELRQAFLDRYFPYKASEIKPMVGRENNIAKYVGTYMESRTALKNSEKLLFALTRYKKVTDNHDGTISFRDTRYVEVEPLIFREVGGQGILVFHQDEKGNITNAFQDFEPHEGYIKLKWYESLDLYMMILTICILVFLAVIIRWIFTSIVKRKNKKTQSIHCILAEIFSGLYLLFILGLFLPVLVQVITNPRAMYGAIFGSFPAMLNIFNIFLIIGGILNCIEIINCVYSWIYRKGSIFSRLIYSIIAVEGIVYIYCLQYWNLLGFYK